MTSGRRPFFPLLMERNACLNTNTNKAKKKKTICPNAIVRHHPAASEQPRLSYLGHILVFLAYQDHKRAEKIKAFDDNFKLILLPVYIVELWV